MSATSTPAPPPAPTIALGRYIGHYPFDKISGTSFLEQPPVRRAIRAAVGDAEIRRWILQDAGPQTPIKLVAGQMLSWGCEAHNCGSHNWTVALDQDGSRADICYHDDSADPQTIWYADGLRQNRVSDCPSGDE